MPEPDRDNPKVRQLMAGARRLFLDMPYDGVSTDAIARAAGVSKATLYAHFASKEDLFAALICDECRAIASGLPAIVSEAGDVETVLRRVARQFLAMFATPDALSLHRIMIAEAPRFPELGQIFFRSGPRVLKDRLAAFLERADARGLVAITDPQLAATQFLSLVEGDIPLRALVAVQAVSQAECDALVEGGIRVFLAAYGRNPKT